MKDSTEFRLRFAAWKAGNKVYDAGRPIPKYDGGTGKKLNNRSFVLNVFHDDKSMYDSLTENGYPEQAADQYTKDIEDYRLGLSNDDISGYDGGELREVVVTPQNGLILPEVEAVPYNLTLDTYYPWSESYRGVGHSSLYGNHGHLISVASDDPGYNLVFNNCSDATRTALEAATGNKIDPWLFTTPGDVQQFFKLQFPDYKTEYSKGGRTRLSAVVTKEQYDKFLNVADSLRALRYKNISRGRNRMHDCGKALPKYDMGDPPNGEEVPELITGPISHVRNPIIQQLAPPPVEESVDRYGEVFKAFLDSLDNRNDAERQWMNDWLKSRRVLLGKNYMQTAYPGALRKITDMFSYDPNRDISRAYYIEAGMQEYDRQMKALDSLQERAIRKPGGARDGTFGQYIHGDHSAEYYTPDKEVVVHERSHALRDLENKSGNYLGNSPQVNAIRKILQSMGYKNLKDGISADKYLDNPDEIYSRLMEVRYKNKLDPTHTVTEEDLNKMKDHDDSILNRYNTDTLLKLFNEVAQNIQSRSDIYYADKGKSIHIKPANRGKFNATKKRTGKTTEQLAHSKNPLTRKRAIFALNSRKFKH